MSERPSQNKQILQKLDELFEVVGEVKVKVAEIETKITYQPKIDEQKFEAIAKAEVICKANVDNQIKEVREETKALRENQTWATRTLIGEGIAIIISLIGMVFSLMK